MSISSFEIPNFVIEFFFIIALCLADDSLVAIVGYGMISGLVLSMSSTFG